MSFWSIFRKKPQPLEQAELADLDEELKVRRIEFTDGSFEIDMTPSQRISAHLVHAFREQLKDAKNYVEMSLRHPVDGTYVITIVRPQGKTPHQQLLAAQKRIAELESQLKQ